MIYILLVAVMMAGVPSCVPLNGEADGMTWAVADDAGDALAVAVQCDKRQVISMASSTTTVWWSVVDGPPPQSSPRVSYWATDYDSINSPLPFQYPCAQAGSCALSGDLIPLVQAYTSPLAVFWSGGKWVISCGFEIVSGGQTQRLVARTVYVKITP